MTLRDRLRQLASALPSDDAAVSFTRSDLLALLDEDGISAAPARDLSVEEVAEETRRAPSTVRGWLISGALIGFKLNQRDWRIPQSALRNYLKAQTETSDPPRETGEVDIAAWRKVHGAMNATPQGPGKSADG